MYLLVLTESLSAPWIKYHSNSFTMSFHASATSIELDDGHILKATLLNAEGEEVESTLDLNEIIGNNNGTSHSLLVDRLERY